MKTIVLICGAAGAGKDAAAAALVNRAGFARTGFADPLKDAVAIISGVPRAWFDDPQGKDEPLGGKWVAWTPRGLLKFIGTDLIRDQLDPDTWVHALATRIVARPEVTRWVVPDCRFPNELALHTYLPLGYECHAVKVVRPGHEPTSTGHESDQDLPVGSVIVNDSTLCALAAKALAFAATVIREA